MLHTWGGAQVRRLDMTQAKIERCLTGDIAKHGGERVRLNGWLFRMRRMGGINFLILRDRSGTAQIVVDQETAQTSLKGLLSETVLEVVGTVVTSSQAPGGVEVINPEFTILSPVTETVPFEINKPELKASLETFLDHATVGLRHPRRQ